VGGNYFAQEFRKAAQYGLHHPALGMGGAAGGMLGGARDCQASDGNWEIVQDSLADLVRVMLARCYDEKNHKGL